MDCGRICRLVKQDIMRMGIMGGNGFGLALAAIGLINNEINKKPCEVGES